MNHVGNGIGMELKWDWRGPDRKELAKSSRLQTEQLVSRERGRGRGNPMPRPCVIKIGPIDCMTLMILI